MPSLQQQAPFESFPKIEISKRESVGFLESRWNTKTKHDVLL